MFETLEKELTFGAVAPDLGAVAPKKETPFGTSLSPTSVRDAEIARAIEFDPMREAMEETIATLRQALDQKEQALAQTTIAATGLQQQLDKSKTHYEHLRKKLTTVVKAHEGLTQKIAAAEQAEGSQERQIPESTVAHMKEQWRVAQKSMEREHARLRGELAKTKAGWHQTGQELEIQSRARRSEGAHASLQVANLEREIATVRATKATTGASAGSGNMLVRLSATAAGTAVLMLALGIWWQYGRSESSHTDTVQAATAPAASVTAPIVSVRSTTPSSGSLSGMMVSRGAFQKALGRLNNNLYGPIGVSPEQILRAVREANAKTNPNVCNFQWNNGQPSLYFGGAQQSLESSLDGCADAVDGYLRPKAKK